MYGMNKGKLLLVPYDFSWEDDFFAEKRRISFAVLDSSVRIEHIGSTSIPSIYAKPILDIAILCNDKGLESVVNALTELGYKYRGHYDEKGGHYYAVLDDNNIRLCQAHIYIEANADWYSKLKFRDVLRQDVELAREYNDYKLELAKTTSNKSEYAEIKSKWVDTFMLKVSEASGDSQLITEGN